MFAEHNKYMIKICARVVIYYGKVQVSIFSFPLAGYERCQIGRGNGGVQN